jgi:hypothetical protein
MMARRIEQPIQPEAMIYIGQFSGLKMTAFGREQILDYTTHITVTMESLFPPVWVARELAAKTNPAYNATSAEETMRRVEQAFATQIGKWQTYAKQGLFGTVKLGPILVPKPPKTA